MSRNEDLIHAINGTDLLPVLVPQVDELVRKSIGWWYHTQPLTSVGEIIIRVSKEKFYPDQNGSEQVGTVHVDTRKAIMICSGVGRKALVLELEDPDCFDKLEEWLKKLSEKNPWRRR